MNYVNAGDAVKAFKISYVTLKRWREEGRIKVKELSKKKILYDIDSLNESPNEDRCVLYARVSTQKQKNDLDHQITLIKEYMISNGIKPSKIYSDIASGLNEDRKGLNELLGDVVKHNVSKVYITFKDRLTRFGYEYFKIFFKLHNVEIIVIDELDNNKSSENELVEDIISIIHHYSTKLYSNRKNRFKEIQKILETDLDK